MIELIRRFLTSPFKNQWLTTPEMELYVRQGVRFINGKRYTALDLANFEVADKGKGYFGNLLTQVETINPYEIVCIENVLNWRLEHWLIRRGYTQIPGVINSYYKVTHVEKRMA